MYFVVLEHGRMCSQFLHPPSFTMANLINNAYIATVMMLIAHF